MLSLTVIPLLAPFPLRRKEGARRNLIKRVVFLFDRRIICPLRDFYVRPRRGIWVHGAR